MARLPLPPFLGRIRAVQLMWTMGLTALAAVVALVVSPAASSRPLSQPVPGSLYQGIYARSPIDYWAPGSNKLNPRFGLDIDRGLDGLVKRITTTGKLTPPGTTPPIEFLVSENRKRAAFALTVELKPVDLGSPDFDFVTGQKSLFREFFDARGPDDDLLVNTRTGGFRGTSCTEVFGTNRGELYDIGGGGTQIELPDGRTVPVMSLQCSRDGNLGSFLYVEGGFVRARTGGKVRKVKRRKSVEYVDGVIGAVIVACPTGCPSEPDTEPSDALKYATGGQRYGLVPFAGPACNVFREGKIEKQAKCDKGRRLYPSTVRRSPSASTATSSAARSQGFLKLRLGRLPGASDTAGKTRTRAEPFWRGGA